MTNLQVKHDGLGRRLAVIEIDYYFDGVCVILGPNGAGKSSLLAILHGIDPVQGFVRWDQFDASSGKASRAFVTQEPILFDGTAIDNFDFAGRALGLNASQIAKRSEELIAQFGLAALANRHISQLSVGERARINLARALMGSPKALLMDEPTAALDPVTTRHFEELTRDFAATAGQTAFFVSHDLAQAQRLATTIMFIESGQIRYLGDAEGFFAQDDRWRQYMLGAPS